MKLLDCPVSNVIEVPVDFKADFTDLPDGTYFIVSPSTIFKLLKTPIVETLLPYEGDSAQLRRHIYGSNKEYKPQTGYMLSTSDDFKIADDDMVRVMRFFREVYDKHKSESAVILLVNTTTKDFKILYVVNYDVSGGHVGYINPVQKHDKNRINELLKNKLVAEQHEIVLAEYEKLYAEGYRMFGTIHSHCDFSAFHSSVDDADEIQSDGLHITIGNCRSGWSYSQRWGISGFFWPIQNIDSLLNTPIAELQKRVDDIDFDPDLDLKHVFTPDFERPKTLAPHWSSDAFYFENDDENDKRFNSNKQRYNPKTRSWEPAQTKLTYADMYEDIARKTLGKATPIKKNPGSSSEKTEESKIQTLNLEEMCEEFEDDIWPEESCVFVLDTDTNNTYILRLDFYISNKEVIDEAVNLRVINNGYEHLEGSINDIPD